MEKDRYIGNGIWLSDVSKYGIENNRVDYKALAKSVGSKVLANTYMNEQYDFGEVSGLNLHSGSLYEYYDNDGDVLSDDEYFSLDDYDRDYISIEFKEFFQYYIVSESALRVLEAFNETVLYFENHDLYVWCIDHWGTGWDYVLTDVKIDDSKG